MTASFAAAPIRLSLLRRSFSTSPISHLPPRQSTSTSSLSDPNKPLTRAQAFDIVNIERFGFDDTTSWGHMIMERKRESLELLRAVERDREVLQRQRKPFVPPSSSYPLRFTSTHHLTDSPPPTNSSPTSPSTSGLNSLPPSIKSKRTLVVPVKMLLDLGVIKGEEEVRRLKVLAGARWTPSEKADLVTGEVLPTSSASTSTLSSSSSPSTSVEKKTTESYWKDQHHHGYLKFSESSFPEGRMNRKWLSDVLDRLVMEANTPSLPLPSDLPLPTQPTIARLRKQKKLVPGSVGGAAGAKRKVTGLEGFPREWMH